MGGFTVSLLTTARWLIHPKTGADVFKVILALSGIWFCGMLTAGGTTLAISVIEGLSPPTILRIVVGSLTFWTVLSFLALLMSK